MPLSPDSVYIILFELPPTSDVSRYVSDHPNIVRVVNNVDAALDAAAHWLDSSQRNGLSCYGHRQKTNGPLQLIVSLV